MNTNKLRKTRIANFYIKQRDNFENSGV